VVHWELNEFVAADAEAINQVASAAFLQYREHYQEWEQFSRRLGCMDALAASAEIVVGRIDGRVAGAVAYVAPGMPRASFFTPEWAVLRMLVVEPASRGLGLGRALTLECLRRAERDGAALIALHTSPIMQVALAMYYRLGFEFVRSVPPIHGVPYGIYCKRLGQR